MRRRRAAPAFALLAVVAVVVGSAGLAGASNDAYFPRQWALAQIRAPEAWARSTGSGITIGIVDTGVDAGHPDLAGKILATADCVGRPCASGAAQDAHGHGTIVSGIAAATTDNGRGVAGTAPDARLVVAKVLNSNGEGRAGDINNGIRWVVDQGATVVNLSLGDPKLLVSSALGTPLRSGIDYAWSRGAVPVLASGNYGDLGGGNYGGLNALVVGASNRAGAVPAYSSPVGNAKWGLVAPGGGGGGGVDSNVLSTFPLSAAGSGYASAAGTSMAAAHVSGAMALLLAQGSAPAAAVSRLLGSLDRSVPCGAGCQGRLDVAAAVGSGPATGAAATAATAPAGSTRPRTTVADPTTTTAPPATTSSTVPPPSAPVGDPSELALPLPSGPVPFGDTPARRNRAVVGAAIPTTRKAAVGGVGVRRLRADGRW